MDLLSNCYEKLPTEEADSYLPFATAEEVSCSSEHVASLLGFTPSNYKDKTSEQDLRPTPRQIVLAKAYEVREGRNKGLGNAQ
jgi:hypothetical protein